MVTAQSEVKVLVRGCVDATALVVVISGCVTALLAQPIRDDAIKMIETKMVGL
jgi:hypothetical protein